MFKVFVKQFSKFKLGRGCTKHIYNYKFKIQFTKKA